MLKRGILKAISATVVATAAVAASIGAPLLSANAAITPAATAKAYNIYQQDNGSNVCLDASFEFSVCQTSSNPDDPPSLQRWVLIPAANGTDQIWNRPGTGDCLDVSDFDGPCTKGDASQQWTRVSAGTGTYYIEHKTSSGTMCLDEFWTFKACSKGDKNQIWKFRLPPA